MLTISVGVAVFPEHGTSPKELMAAADAALYGAKHNGRDQVVVASLKGAEEAAMQEAAKSAAGWK
jgi:predicted signal transduction protein with EAL and GGDEF domain